MHTILYFQQPLLVSSANLWRKPGAHSEAQIRKEFKKFEDGDEKNRKLWQWFVDVSLLEINPK